MGKINKPIIRFALPVCLLAVLLLLPLCIFGVRPLSAAADGGTSLDGEDQMQEAEEGAVATVDGASFFTFSEALTAWEEGEGSILALTADAETDHTLLITGEKFLDLGAFTLSLRAGEEGSVLKVMGSLTLYGSGKITGGNAEQGGGVYVDSRGSFIMNGGEISGNRASSDGGGVYVTGSFTLGGNSIIDCNYGSGGEDSNLFLTNGNRVRLSAFTGRAGVTMAIFSKTEENRFTEEEYEGTFFSDDKDYIAEKGKLTLAPLQRIAAEYVGQEKVFPTTDPSSLIESVQVEAFNVNGTAYAGELELELSGTLKVGAGTMTVIARGEGGEEARTTVTLNVEKPTLCSVQVEQPEYPPKVYFDSPLEALAGEGGYTFKGVYDDGNSRTICSTPEATMEKCGEEYIRESYSLSGDLSVREEGKAEVTVHVGDIKTTFLVEVSKYVFSVKEEDVLALSVPEGGTLDIRAFLPELPSGVLVEGYYNGQPLSVPALSAGMYEVELHFSVADAENYEQITQVLNASLTVLRGSLVAREGGVEYAASREGGLPPDWKLTVKDLSEETRVSMEGSLEARKVLEFTVQREGIVVEETGALTLRIPLPEELLKEEVSVYLLGEDRSLTPVEATREGDVLVVRAGALSHAQYVLAVETASRVYLILSIVFGVACVAGAAAILCYLVFKRKMSLR